MDTTAIHIDDDHGFMGCQNRSGIHFLFRLDEAKMHPDFHRCFAHDD